MQLYLSKDQMRIVLHALQTQDGALKAAVPSNKATLLPVTCVGVEYERFQLELLIGWLERHLE